MKINTNEFDRLVCSIVDSVPTEHPYLISIKIIKMLDFLYIVSQFVLESSTKRKTPCVRFLTSFSGGEQ